MLSSDGLNVLLVNEQGLWLTSWYCGLFTIRVEAMASVLLRKGACRQWEYHTSRTLEEVGVVGKPGEGIS